MNFSELHNAALATLQQSGIVAPSAVTADAVYLAAVMAQLLKPESKPLVEKKRGSFVAPPDVEPNFNTEAIDQAVEALYGHHAQARYVFWFAFRREPTNSEAYRVGAYLRAKGFQAFRRAGKTLFIL